MYKEYQEISLRITFLLEKMRSLVGWIDFLTVSGPGCGPHQPQGLAVGLICRRAWLWASPAAEPGCGPHPSQGLAVGLTLGRTGLWVPMYHILYSNHMQPNVATTCSLMWLPMQPNVATTCSLMWLPHAA